MGFARGFPAKRARGTRGYAVGEFKRNRRIGKCPSKSMLPKRRRILAIGIAVGIAVAVFLSLVLVPVPQHFAISGAEIPDMYTCGGIFAIKETTKGTGIAFQWNSAASTCFIVVSCSANQIVYEANGTDGSGYLASVGGDYLFGATCGGPGYCVTADVSGYYTGPLLPL